MKDEGDDDAGVGLGTSEEQNLSEIFAGDTCCGRSLPAMHVGGQMLVCACAIQCQIRGYGGGSYGLALFLSHRGSQKKST